MQILELPGGINGERPPFVLVVDEYEPRRYIMGFDQTEQPVSEFDGVAEKIGARSVLVFAETVTIPANETIAQPRTLPDIADLADLTEVKQLVEARDEARQWARHGYEIGQRHCGWTDHGVAPDWLTEGWPPHIESCEHLKRAAELEMSEDVRKRVAKESKTALLDALGMDHARDWDDIRNAAAGIRKERDAQAAAIERVRQEPAEPEIMDARQEHPTTWKHGYHCGVLAAKGALRPRDEPTVKP
ncbi:hypothetical protein [Streptomyces mirabilis]|uniref:hypothetical protein n=1 Tax=Streptomyces mirabilis TaxID=68239 RepID=UPI00369791E8